MKAIPAICERTVIAICLGMPPAIYLFFGGSTVMMALFRAAKDCRAGGIDAISGFIAMSVLFTLIWFCWSQRHELYYKILLPMTVTVLAIVMVLRIGGVFDPNVFTYESMADGVFLIMGIRLVGEYLFWRSFKRHCYCLC